MHEQTNYWDETILPGDAAQIYSSINNASIIQTAWANCQTTIGLHLAITASATMHRCTRLMPRPQLTPHQ